MGRGPLAPQGESQSLAFGERLDIFLLALQNLGQRQGGSRSRPRGSGSRVQFSVHPTQLKQQKVGLLAFDVVGDGLHQAKQQGWAQNAEVLAERVEHFHRGALRKSWMLVGVGRTG